MADKENIMEYARKCIVFVEHIKEHFAKEHPDWKVKCKICNKTFEEINEENDLRKQHLQLD